MKSLGHSVRARPVRGRAYLSDVHKHAKLAKEHALELGSLIGKYSTGHAHATENVIEQCLGYCLSGVVTGRDGFRPLGEMIDKGNDVLVPAYGPRMRSRDIDRHGLPCFPGLKWLKWS